MSKRLANILSELPPNHRAALEWFLQNTGTVQPWKGSLEDGTLLVSQAKAIFKPKWSLYALSVRKNLKSPYPDRVPIERADGTWAYEYHQEGSEPTERDSEYTNVALMRCLDDGVPVGVLRQVKEKPDPRYMVLGVAMVSKWEDGWFRFDGFNLAGDLHTEETDANLAPPDDLSNTNRSEGNGMAVQQFFSIRTKDPGQVAAISNGSNSIELDNLEFNADKTSVGDIAFLALGGDNPSWPTGLKAVGRIITAPFDFDRSGKRTKFKVKVNASVVLPQPLTRADLERYPKCFNLPLIGPMTKWEPNQAGNHEVGLDAARSLVRAIIDNYPDRSTLLELMLGQQFMAEVRGEIEYYEVVKKSIVTPAQWEPDLAALRRDLIMADSPLKVLTTLVNQQKHVILTGPPGTGKTTIAENACRQAQAKAFSDGYLLTTATADWSTFDTIGGLVPNGTGGLRFREGIFLQALRQNKWLVVDEINRSEADKAFGQLLTVLSGQNITLPYMDEQGNQLQIVHTTQPKSRLDNGTYYVGRNWRIIGTMNTFDRSSLFALSSAFVRRLAPCYVPVPMKDDLVNLVSGYDLDQSSQAVVNRLLEVTPKELGPAIIKDLCTFLKNSPALAGDALFSLVLPQYENLTQTQIRTFYTRLAPVLTDEIRGQLKAGLASYFDINPTSLTNPPQTNSSLTGGAGAGSDGSAVATISPDTESTDDEQE